MTEFESALANFLASGGTVGSDELLATSEDGLVRLWAFIRGAGGRQPLDAPQGPEEAEETLSAALALLAHAHPDALLGALAEDPPETKAARGIAARVLGDIVDPRATALLAVLARNDEWLVRYYAIQSLGNQTDPDALDHLYFAFVDSQQIIRQVAADSLRRHRSHA